MTQQQTLLIDDDRAEHETLITAAGADLALSGASSAGADVQRWLNRIALFVEAHDGDGLQAPIIEADLAAIDREFRLMHSILGQYLDIIRAAAASILKLREQRNAALQELAARPGMDDLFEHVVGLLAQHGDLSLDDARTAAFILCNADENVMEDDVVDGYDALARFREAFAELVDELHTRKVME